MSVQGLEPSFRPDTKKCYSAVSFASQVYTFRYQQVHTVTLSLTAIAAIQHRHKVDQTPFKPSCSAAIEPDIISTLFATLCIMLMAARDSGEAVAFQHPNKRNSERCAQKTTTNNCETENMECGRLWDPLVRLMLSAFGDPLKGAASANYETCGHASGQQGSQ